MDNSFAMDTEFGGLFKMSRLLQKWATTPDPNDIPELIVAALLGQKSTVVELNEKSQVGCESPR
jgi:hypothetical protein